MPYWNLNGAEGLIEVVRVLCSTGVELFSASVED